ncbi:cilia and flagella associated protein 161 [Lamellibrachia satsuma]|nr:cilia and flagella associated protein 161 [Lamellibrachia satsuma]
MAMRTYNPSVRIGNWYEDICLEEDTLKDFIEKRDDGRLYIQRSANWRNSLQNKVELKEQKLGGTVIAVNVTGLEIQEGTAFTGTTGATATGNVASNARTALIVTSIDGSKDGDTLKYGQPFALRTFVGNLFLRSDRSTFMQCAKKSRHNPVTFVNEPSHLCEWRILPYNPQIRLELEFSPVPANEKIVINHVKTNEDLCVEWKHTHRTAFGPEHEVSTHTILDSHKVEIDVNHWMLMLTVPGDDIMPMQGVQ